MKSPIPDDVWHEILQYVLLEGSHNISSMITVNSFFLEAGLQARYKSVTVDDLGSRKFYKFLNRLKDPYIRERPQKLTIRIGLGIGMPYNWSAMTTKMGHFARRFLGSKVDQQPTESSSATPGPFSPLHVTISKQCWVPGTKHTDGRDQVLSDLLDVVIKLPSVTELYWDSLWDTSDIVYSRNFFSAIWEHFGSNLRTLRLRGNVEGLETFLAYARPESLEKLDISIKESPRRHRGKRDLRGPNDNVLMSKLSHSLRELKISKETEWHRPVGFPPNRIDTGKLTLDPFLWDLRVCTRLDSLSLIFPLDACVSVPAKLSGLLNIPSIRTLDLQLQTEREYPSSTTERDFGQFVSTDLSHLEFNELQRLTFYPPVFSSPFLPDRFLRTSATLRSLTILERVVTLKELQELFATFEAGLGERSRSPQLEQLSLSIERLEPAILGTLACAVPGLRSVDLFVQRWGDTSDTVLQHDNLFTLLHAFNTHLDVHLPFLSQWQLSSLGIWMHLTPGPSLPVWKSQGPSSTKFRLRQMLALRAVLVKNMPNLRWVCGKRPEEEWRFRDRIYATGLEDDLKVEAGSDSSDDEGAQ